MDLDEAVQLSQTVESGGTELDALRARALVLEDLQCVPPMLAFAP